MPCPDIYTCDYNCLRRGECDRADKFDPAALQPAVTEEMITAACKEAGWVVSDASEEDATVINRDLRASMRDILNAALRTQQHGAKE
jgi:hypothetical protein